MDATTEQPVSYADLAAPGVHNAWLDEQTGVVRQQVVAWDSYNKANLIAPDELQRLLSYDKLSQPKLRAVLEQEGPQYVAVLAACLGKIPRADTVQYLLTMLDDALALSVAISTDFVKSLATQETAVVLCAALIKFLNKDDELTQLKAAKVFAMVACLLGPLPNETLAEFFHWIIPRLTEAKYPNTADVALQCLLAVLRITKYRQPFMAINGSVQALVDIMKKMAPGPQSQYAAISCLWLLSFEEQVAADLQRKYEALSILIDTAKSALKEKVVRVCIATMRNMLAKAHEANILPMVSPSLCRLAADVLCSRKFSDEEIMEDVAYLRAELEKSIQSLSTWDEYASEVRSGKLEWSPVHTNEQFWKQNASRLNEKNHELLRLLSRTLSTSTNAIVLAVACHDFALYIKHYSNGRKIVQELGAKQQIMELMTHENAEVRYNALLAVQNYMTNAW